MKECTYGWYPSAPTQDVWKHYRSQTKGNTYENECLYKHSNSRYVDRSGVATPVAPSHIRLEISPSHSYQGTSDHGPPSACASRPPTGLKRVRPSPRKAAWSSYVPGKTEHASMSPQPPSMVRETVTGSPSRPQRVQSAQVQRQKISAHYNPRPVQSAGSSRPPVVIPTPPAVSHARAASADHRSPDLPPHVKVLMKSASTGDIQRPQEGGVVVSYRPSPDRKRRPYTAVDQRRQIVTADLRRATTPEPHRHLTTPELPEYTQDYTAQDVEQDLPVYGMQEPDDQLFSTAQAQGPSPSPVHFTVPEPEEPGQYQELLKQQSSMYETKLKEHGWRMQVHGDPLNLKTPCITKRLTCVATCEVPTGQQAGPTGYMVNYDTNFYNTIPRRRATFDVHREWISEVLHAKRMELQKRDGGIKYRYKNFSFVY